jgi:hypothetical protein
MPDVLRNGLIFILIIFFPITVYAMSSIKDADAVITMRDGKPCFSYPQDKEIQARPYSFGSLSVSNRSSVGRNGWAIEITSAARKGLLEPSSPATCIRYGIHHPGTESKRPAERLLMYTPYDVLIVVHSPPLGPVYERKFLSEFCLARDEKGNTVVVHAQWNDDMKKRICLKPGEYPKCSFWQKLFR